MMGYKINISLVFLISSPFLGQVLGLLTIPVPDDLLGPGKCPTGAFCIDTDYCTHEYYTTNSGLPFYCGPHHEIDSMICCLSAQTGVGYLENLKAAPTPAFYSGDNDDVTDVKRLHRSNPNVTMNLGESDDDEEVDILSLPFLANNELDDEPFDVPLPNSNELEGHFDTLNNLESLVEEAIEQELNSAKFGSSPSVDDGAGSAFIDNNPPDPDQFRRPLERDSFSNENGDELRLNTATFKILDRLQKSKISQSNSDADSEASAETTNLEGRSYANKYQYQGTPTCACEKGEKGEPGPKGDPGEPGKIVYIPVFVNAESGAPSGFHETTFGSQPWQFDSPENLYRYQFNQQQHRPVRQNNVPPPLPQRQNPTVIPYQVPAPGPQSVALTQPIQHFKNPQTQHQPRPQPPSPLSTANPRDLQDRLARHASQGNKRYHRAN